MTLEVWLLFCATETVLCFTPGPAVLLVVSMSLSRGIAAGLRASLGILTSNAFYFILSATGIGAILLASWELFFLIKWVGAVYLIWLGGCMLLSRPVPVDDHAAVRPLRRGFGPYAHGVVTQGANPKALVFFSALLPQFITPGAPMPTQVAILAASSILIELVVLAVYSVVCHHARAMVSGPRVVTSLNRAGGALLIGAGAGLATLHRS